MVVGVLKNGRTNAAKIVISTADVRNDVISAISQTGSLFELFVSASLAAGSTGNELLYH